MSDYPLPSTIQTIQDIPDALQGEATTGFWVVWPMRGPILPAWGTRDRERALWRYYHHDRNTLVQGAFAGLAKKIASTPWEITGPQEDSAYFQGVLRGAQFGAGWGDFIKRLVLNFLRHDIGAFVEIIGPGHPRGPLIGRVTGLAVMDSLKCYPTGDPIYPVIYSATDGLHLMHHTRVLRLVDMVDASDEAPGVGLCALSRAIAIVQRELYMGKYIDQFLDDRPKPAIYTTTNISPKEWEKLQAYFWRGMEADAQGAMGRSIVVHGAQAELPAKVDALSFSEAPEKFDYTAYTELHVKALALAIGVDPQDLWELTSHTLGSATQSEILATKARGKTEGDLRTEIERALNDVLPPEFEFAFAYQDAQEDLERAQIRQTNATTVQTISASLSPDEVRNFLAATDETLRDILTDDFGNVRTLTDADPEPETVAGDASALAQDVPVLVAAGAEEPAPALAEKLPPLVAKSMPAAHALRLKVWSVTRAQFIADVSDLLRGRTAGEITGRRFGVVLRAILNRLGTQAFRDGLQDGGVADTSELDGDDMRAIQDWLGEQSPFVSGLATEIRTRGLSEADLAIRADLWANKSLRRAYQLGLKSAAANGAFRWELGATEEHCTDCLRLNGQVHRLRNWERRGWVPGATKLQCGGYQCDCKLVRTNEKARGRF